MVIFLQFFSSPTLLLNPRNKMSRLFLKDFSLRISPRGGPRRDGWPGWVDLSIANIAVENAKPGLRLHKQYSQAIEKRSQAMRHYLQVVETC